MVSFTLVEISVRLSPLGLLLSIMRLRVSRYSGTDLRAFVIQTDRRITGRKLISVENPRGNSQLQRLEVKVLALQVIFVPRLVMLPVLVAVLQIRKVCRESP